MHISYNAKKRKPRFELQIVYSDLAHKKKHNFFKNDKNMRCLFCIMKKNVLRIYIGLENQILRSFFMENNIHYRHLIYI